MEKDLLWNFENTRKKLDKTTWGLRWLVRKRDIPIVKIGRKIYFDPDDVKEWIEQHKIKAIKEEFQK